jgi:hypothetical protein
MRSLRELAIMEVEVFVVLGVLYQAAADSFYVHKDLTLLRSQRNQNDR